MISTTTLVHLRAGIASGAAALSIAAGDLAELLEAYSTFRIAELSGTALLCERAGCQVRIDLQPAPSGLQPILARGPGWLEATAAPSLSHALEVAQAIVARRQRGEP